MTNSQIRKLTPAEALPKILRYCAYQERSHQEVKNKLFEYGLWTEEVDEMLARLVTEGFLNEERFARAFAGGKFRMKKWGRLKIQHALEHRGLTKNCISRGMKEIEALTIPGHYGKCWGRKRVNPLKTTFFKKRSLIARFAISKGFEPDLVWELVKELVPD